MVSGLGAQVSSEGTFPLLLVDSYSEFFSLECTKKYRKYCNTDLGIYHALWRRALPAHPVLVASPTAWVFVSLRDRETLDFLAFFGTRAQTGT